MKKLSLLALIFMPILLFGQVEWGKLSTKKVTFIRENLAYAQWVERRYRVPKEVTLAIAALESGWGLHDKSIVRKNYLGMNIPGSNELQFFPTLVESYRAFGNLLFYSPRYGKLKEAKSYKEYCRALNEQGYNQNPAYASALISIIEQNQFHKIP